MTAVMLVALSAGAILLASVGIFGLMSYVVAGRSRELGIRMALGAQRVDILRLVLREGLVLSSIGVGIGLPLAIGLMHLMSSMLYGVSSTDASTYAVVVALLTFIALGASYIPARRAAKVDPTAMLR